MVTPLPAQPTDQQDPWYTTFKTWMDGVQITINELNANDLTHTDLGGGTLVPVGGHLPVGGTVNQVLGKTSGSNYAVSWRDPSGGSGVTPPVAIVGTDAATAPLTVTGAASQTALIFSVVLNGGSTPSLGVTNTGEVRVGNSANNFNGTLKVGWTDGTRKGVVVRGAANQSAALFEAEDNAGGVLFSVSSNGTVAAPNIGAPLLVLNSGDTVPNGTPVGTVILRRP